MEIDVKKQLQGYATRVENFLRATLPQYKNRLEQAME